MKENNEKTEYTGDAFRDLPVIDTKDLRLLGEGSNGTVYQLDENRVLKVPKKEVPFEEMLRERELSEKALLCGVPCQRYFGFALVDGRPAQINEMASTTSFLKLIRKDPENLDRYLGDYVNLIRKLHSVTGDALKVFPQGGMFEELLEKADRLDSLLPEEYRGGLRRILKSIDEPQVLTHGDIQPKNIRISEKGAMFIDLETLSAGPAVIDLGSLYRTLFADWLYGGQDSNTFLEISAAQSKELWEKFTKAYFAGQDEDFVRISMRNAETIGHILAVAKMQKRGVQGAELENGIRSLEEMIRAGEDSWILPEQSHQNRQNRKQDLSNFMISERLKAFVKKNVVMVVALCAAIITSFIVPPDSQYINYFDFKTLTCLFCVLAVVCALKNIHFFYMLARKVVTLFRNLRMSVLALVYITFIGSMLIANDMALLTFLPLGFLVLTTTKQEKYMAFTFIMQNIAANLGGMLTPFGNPQNLYLYTKFNIPNLEFIQIMAPPFALSIALITLCCIIFVKPEPLKLDDEKIELNPWKTALYLVLFTLSIAIVFRTIPYWIGLIVIPTVLLFVDRSALKKVDYPLLLTFVFFFIFAGNMSRIEVVRTFMSGLLEKNTLVFSTLSCQVISNVPSAILLSQFTTNYPDLLVGVNIGGVGTLIASLASLITFREYVKHNPDKTGYYIKRFSEFNFSFLFILLGFMSLLKAL